MNDATAFPQAAPEPPKRKGISPCDCNHRRRQFICSGWATGIDSSGRHGVTVCKDCGEFHVFMEKDGVSMSVEFALVGDETVEAAGRWNAFLKACEECEEAEPEPEVDFDSRYAPNVHYWKPGDLVIHLADAKKPEMLMRVLGYNPTNGLVRSQYITEAMPSSPRGKKSIGEVYENDLRYLLQPARFGIALPEAK